MTDFIYAFVLYDNAEHDTRSTGRRLGLEDLKARVQLCDQAGKLTRAVGLVAIHVLEFCRCEGMFRCEDSIMPLWVPTFAWTSCQYLSRAMAMYI